MQHFWADSKYLGKINTKKKINFFFQCLALPKDSQSFGILITMLYKYHPGFECGGKLDNLDKTHVKNLSNFFCKGTLMLFVSKRPQFTCLEAVNDK